MPAAQPARTQTTEPEGRGSWWYPGVVAATILLASGQREVATPGVLHSDKIGHFLLFGLLATLVARTQPRARGWWGAVAASVFGMLDETRQSFTPGRSVEVADWIADTSGAVLAVALYLHWPWYRRLLERPLRWRRAEP